MFGANFSSSFVCSFVCPARVFYDYLIWRWTSARIFGHRLARSSTRSPNSITRRAQRRKQTVARASCLLTSRAHETCTQQVHTNTRILFVDIQVALVLLAMINDGRANRRRASERANQTKFARRVQTQNFTHTQAKSSQAFWPAQQQQQQDFSLSPMRRLICHQQLPAYDENFVRSFVLFVRFFRVSVACKSISRIGRASFFLSGTTAN